MAVQSAVHHEFPYLRVEVKGTAQLADLRRTVALAAAECTAASCRRCLFDFRDMEANLAPTEQLQLGTYAGEMLRSLEKVASVVTPTLRTGTCASAAQKLGVRIRAFTDIDDARAWMGT